MTGQVKERPQEPRSREKKSHNNRSRSPKRLDRRGSRDRSPKRDNGTSSSRNAAPRGLSFHCYDFIPKHSPRRAFEKHYTLGQLLGEGGFGAAYVCHHKLTGEERAVKILPKSDEEAMKEAYQEFRMMAKMDHPVSSVNPLSSL